MEKRDYWNDIPVGKENAIKYRELMALWGMSKRGVRAKLYDLSKEDNSDKFVLIRSSFGKGFYRTDDKEEIERFKREVMSRACNTFAPLKKINRILGEDENQMIIEL